MPGPGMAQQFVDCEFSHVTNADFGELDLSLDSEAPFRTTAELNIDCRQGEPNETVYVCLHLDAGSGGGNSGARQLRGPNSDRPLLYNVYKYPEFRGDGSVWGSAFWEYGPRPPLFEVRLDSNGRADSTETLYFEVWRPRRQITLPPGNYDSLFVGMQSRLEYGYETGNNCNESLPFVDRMSGFEVEATVVEPTLALGFSKAFVPATIGQYGISRLTFRIDSSANLFDQIGLNFTDDFPDGMVVAPDPDASMTCIGGTLSAEAGGSAVGYSGGSVAAGQTCTVSVDVQALVLGTLVNRSGGLATQFLPGAAPPAEAALTVTNDPPVAEAGAALTVDEGAAVSLDGSGSSDPEGEALGYAWTGPAGVTL